MAAQIIVTETFGLTAPSGAVLQRSEQDITVQPVKMQGVSSGKVVTVKATTLKYFTKTVKIAFKGAVSFAAVVAGSITAGTVKVTRVAQNEMNKDYPDGEMEGITYGNVAS
jgi:hypothetical protein